MANKDTNPEVFPDHMVLSKIFIIRDHKVMIDRDLAELYGVETRTLNQAIERNLEPRIYNSFRTPRHRHYLTCRPDCSA